MKRGKEISLNVPYEYNVISGTVDNKNPKSIYIQISLFEVLGEDKFYRDRSIVDFNMASSGISLGKRSFMSVEMTLFQKEPLIPINSNDLIPTLNEISSSIIGDVFEKDEDFRFYRKKM